MQKALAGGKLHTRAEMQSPVLEYLALLSATLLGAALRLYRLGDWSFWADEVFTLGLKEDGFNFSLWQQSFAGGMIRMVTGWLGTSEWSARLAPALIGILSIPVLYFFLKRALGTFPALAATALLAVSPWHLYWSQNARFYTLLLLFYSLALLLFYIGFEEDRPLFVLLSLVFLGLAARERLLALFFLPVAAAYLVFLPVFRFQLPPGYRLRNIALFFVPLLLLGAFFAAPYVGNLQGWLSGFGWVNNNPFWLTAGIAYYVGLPVVLFGLAGAACRLLKKDRAALLFGLGAVLPAAALVALSLFQYTANRYVFITLTSWMALAALASDDLFRSTQRGARLLPAGVLALLLLTLLSEDVLYFGYQNGNRENARAAYQYILEHRQADDLIVAANTELGNYYTGNQTVGYGSLNEAEIEASQRDVWFVEDMNTEQHYPQKFAWLVENARMVASYDVNANARLFKMRVYRYEPDPAKGK